MPEPKEPTVGAIVHLLHGGACYAAIVTSIDDNGTGLHPFQPPPPLKPGLRDGWQPYNSLHSARPTSGWHWPQEH